MFLWLFHGGTRRWITQGLLLPGSSVALSVQHVQKVSLLHARHCLLSLSGLSTHKWLGCLVSRRGSGHTTADVEFHLSSASRAFYANQQTLCDKNVSILDRLRYFDAFVSPVACFVAGHRALHQGDLNGLGVAFRKHLRHIVGPPINIQWDGLWHEILHEWNARAMDYWARTGRPHGLKTVCSNIGSLLCMLLISPMNAG